jgi:glycosyltransferase involved in cell wall biosynthesis
MSGKSAVRVGLHDYRTDPLLPQRDGVNFAHENIAHLLRAEKPADLEIEFHDFNALLADDSEALRVLSSLDCVISNVGPHAHYYFWLREKLGLDFRILRDVRTAIWSSYLFQEHLAAPLLRPDDTLMVASNYVWGVYRRMFPHLAAYPAAVCYPLGVSFPKPRPGPRAARADERCITLGYLGRLSEDKNFPDLVELLISLNREGASERRYRLVACGQVHSDSCAPEPVNRRIAEALGDGDWFEHLPARPHERIWELFERFDVMIFPSTSNLETFGRVLIEASYAGVPVVSGRHAAAPELVHEAGLCAVDYERGRPFVTHFDHRLGRVDVAEMARAITSRVLRPSQSYEAYADHPDLFLGLLRKAPSIATPELSLSQAAFIEALEVVLPVPPGRDEAVEQIAELADWFLALQDRGGAAYSDRIAHLLEITPYPERTKRFIDKSAATNGDFTNVGGIDMELCHLRQFYPQFEISEAP